MAGAWLIWAFPQQNHPKSDRLLVVITALRNEHGIVFHCIDKAVAVIDTARPETGQLVLQGFRFTDTRKGIAFDIPNQLIDTHQGFSILCLPIKVVFPAFGGELNLHFHRAF
uniref:Uncharacterized protein n=1 Tax=Candidatus Kentrum sp. DK TaxID=2126562 RepID=A0A450SYP8_9GAMM|nr:MAG: hypothetical protein BECKDK2373B_GA0170837_10826 [Candidatus Kentron sp. DK]